jgi:hypothetical protein
MFENMKKIRQTSFAASLFLSTAIVTLAASSPALAQYLGQYSEEQAINSYSQSQYHYCDAKLLADYWQMEIGRSKVGIGAKILRGYGGNIPDFLADSRDLGNTCAWGETGFGYDDAERLSSLWNLGGVGEGKDKIAAMATAGYTDELNRALGY